MDIDPLTVPWSYDLQPWGWGCDCPAQGKEFMRHDETCAVTPIYAGVIKDVVSVRDCYTTFAVGNMAASYQTVIKCAQCGRERLGRDLLVIYQAPLSTGSVWRARDDPKYPHNIVKAVCPEHSRPGSINYQRVAPNGH